MSDADAPSGHTERLFTGYSGRLLVSASVGWFAIQGGRLLLSPLLPAIRADLHLSSTAAGIVFTTLWGLYALLQFPSGRLSDALSRKTLLVAGMVAAIVGFSTFTVAPTYAPFLVGAAVVGVGAGLYPTAARALLSDLFVERRGRAFGLHTGLGDLGGAAAAGVAALALTLATWRVAFLPAVVVLVVVVAALHRFSDETYVLGTPSLDVAATGRRLVADRNLMGVLVGYALYALTWQGSTSFLPTYLAEAKSFSPAVASAGFGALFVVGAVVKPTAGVVGDYFPRSLVATASLVLGAAALALLVVAQSTLLIAVSVVLFAVGLMSYPPVIQARLMDLFPAESAGGDLGAMRTAYISVGALGPTVVGVVADAVSFTAAFTVLAGTLSASAVLIAWFGRRG